MKTDREPTIEIERKETSCVTRLFDYLDDMCAEFLLYVVLLTIVFGGIELLKGS